MTASNTFAKDFPPATREAWTALVEKTLKGQPLPEAHVGGVIVKALYTADGRRALRSRRRLRPGTPSGRGTCGQRSAHPDPARANAEALADLEGGAASVLVRIDPTGRTGVAVGSADASGAGAGPGRAGTGDHRPRRRLPGPAGGRLAGRGGQGLAGARSWRSTSTPSAPWPRPGASPGPHPGASDLRGQRGLAPGRDLSARPACSSPAAASCTRRAARRRWSWASPRRRAVAYAKALVQRRPVDGAGLRADHPRPAPSTQDYFLDHRQAARRRGRSGRGSSSACGARCAGARSRRARPAGC